MLYESFVGFRVSGARTNRRSASVRRRIIFLPRELIPTETQRTCAVCALHSEFQNFGHAHEPLRHVVGVIIAQNGETGTRKYQ